jgi:NTP pyrophosphatase (non-canonical NTP hydrolase)
LLKYGWDAIQNKCYDDSARAGWWDGVSDDDLSFIVPVKLCLVHSEISEAMEGHRKDMMDDKLPHRKAIEVELADAIIRIGDLAGRLGLDVGGAIDEKMDYNLSRNDHKKEVRAAAGGKKY